MAIAASPDRTWDLRRVTAPTLVIHGLVDPLVMPSGGIATARAIPGSQLVMYPDMGHDLPRPRWDEMHRRDRRATPGSARSATGRPATAPQAGHDRRRTSRPALVALDVEGVLLPEIWIAVAERTGIDELRRTTRDEPDYDVLMRGRLALLERHGLTMSIDHRRHRRAARRCRAPSSSSTRCGPARRSCCSRTRSPQFARPLMAQLGWPTILCHDLEVVDDRIVGYRLRMADQKRHAVEAFQCARLPRDRRRRLLQRRVDAAGRRRRLPVPRPGQRAGRVPALPAFDTYDELSAAIDSAIAGT